MDINFNVFLENIEYKKGIKSNQNHSSVFTVYVYSNPFSIETYFARFILCLVFFLFFLEYLFCIECNKYTVSSSVNE